MSAETAFGRFRLFDDDCNVIMVEFLKFTQSRSVELAEYAEAVSRSPLAFVGLNPLEHSAHNHVHLWKLEYLADRCDWIDIEYRVEFVNFILEQWRRRLKGLPPYREHGYRVFVYEDLAPTISVVAETDGGFPYSSGTPVFVKTVREILALYATRSWKVHFTDADQDISTERVVTAVTNNKGSIGRPTAQQLGLPVGKLRLLIVNMGLAEQVNEIRKRYRRPPSDFTNELPYSDRWHVFERRLPPRYR